jgi:hypothetical protein
MTQMRHLRCNRCDDDIVVNAIDFDLHEAEVGWVYCRRGFDRWDFCPSCWEIILKATEQDTPK